MRPLPVLTALSLCALAWLLAWSTGALSRSTTPANTTEAQDFVPVTLDPAAVTTLEATLDDATITARRADRPAARWLVTDASSTWPADEAALRDTLRALTTAQLRPATEAPPATNSSLTATTTDTTLVLRLAPTPTGGLLQGTLSTTDATTPVLAPAALADLPLAAANGAWRSPALLPRIEPGPSQLSVSTPEATAVTLRKRNARWSLDNSPARVDEEAATTLIARLTALRAANWLRPTPGDRASEPLVTITLTTTRPPDLAWTQTLEILGRADLAGQLVAVRATLTTESETPSKTWSVRAAVPASALAGLPASTVPLTDPRSLPAPPADVVRIDYEGQSFTRDQRRWRTADNTLLPDSEAESLEAFLTLLASRNAEVLAAEPETPALDAPTTLTLHLAGDPTPRTYTLAQHPGRLIVTEGTTPRAYPGAQAWRP
jgi:hypothetical protein